jgi:hypothetical protein
MLGVSSLASPSSGAGHNILLKQLKQTQTNLATLTNMIAHGEGAGAPPTPTHPGSLACRDSVPSLVGLPDVGMAVDGPVSSSAAPAIPCARQDGDGCLVLSDGTTQP